jgi:hypothetical protein
MPPTEASNEGQPPVNIVDQGRRTQALVIAVVLLATAGCAASPEPTPTATPSSVAPSSECVPPITSDGAPPGKPIPPSLALRPIGPLGSGFAVEFFASANDGSRSWVCVVRAPGQWNGVDLPADVIPIGGASDGSQLAFRDSADDEAPLDDRLILAAPGAGPQVIELSQADDPHWLDDWSFWGTVRALPRGGFLLAEGTRLGLVIDGKLSFRGMPANLTPISPTSDPHAWIVASASDRAEGGINGPLMLWREGESEAVNLGAWSNPKPATIGLAWLRGDGFWALLQADGSTHPRPTDGLLPHQTDIAPDGSADLVTTGEKCDSQTPEACDVRLVDAHGNRLAELPGPGTITWGSGTALFITQIDSSLSPEPQVLWLSGGKLAPVSPPT